MKIRNIGQQEVAGQKFEGISGGFGGDKRSILARDIAKIHGVSVKAINQNINRNRRRFNENDLIDLKEWPKFEKALADLDFSPREIGNANNIYLLSERGYSKLLKIMDSDSAWDMYEKLVDEYFALKNTRAMTHAQRIQMLKLEDKKEAKAIKKAEMLMKMADKATDSESRMKFLKQAQALLTGQAPIEIAARGDHYASAATVAKRLNVLGSAGKPSGSAVMDIAEKTKIIALEGQENKWGRWDLGKWTFTEEGVAMVEAYIIEKDM